MEIAELVETMMRKREEEQSHRIPDGHWITMRLDGRGFSALTEQKFTKPFDIHFQEAMVMTARTVMAELQAYFAYVGSDEISLVFPPAYTTYDRRAEKLLSLSAGIASSIFSVTTRTLAQFDSRINAFATIGEVMQYCHWRCSDVQRNSVATLTYWTLRREGLSGRQATAQLKEASRRTKIEMLAQRGITYEAIPEWQRDGVAIIWESYEKQGYNPILGVDVLAHRRHLIETPIHPDKYSDWLQSYLEAIGKEK